MADNKNVNEAIKDVWDPVTHTLGTTTTAVITTGDIEIGAVEIKDGTTDTRAKVGVTSAAVAESDNLVGVHDPVLGVTTDAAVITSATGTISAKLRGIIAIFVDVLGVSTGAAVTTDAAGTIQQYLRGIIVKMVDVLGVSTGTKVITDANGSIQQYLRGLVHLWISGLAAGEAHIGSVGGGIIALRDTFNRPGDANDYAANDAVSNSTSAPTARSVAAARVNNGSGYIVGVAVNHEKVSLTPRFRVHFFNSAPTPVNDNAALALTFAITNAASYVGSVDLDPMASNGGTDYSRAQNISIRLPFTCTGGVTTLWFLLQTLDAVVAPGNAKGVTTTIYVDQN